jgi:UDP-N-acetylglucosamine 2-epimerase (non-hydrolysing)
MIRTLFVFGTRPEAIKMCPVVHHLRSLPEQFDVRVCVTGQHRTMLDQVLAAFSVVPDYDLNVMTPGQSLAESTSRILAALDPVITEQRPDLVMVQGDTTTTLAGSLAAFYRQIPVGHVEAGLRTGDLQQPFPEEMNRVVTSRLATLHFAPTETAACHLKREGIAESRVFVTGNTGIDAVLWVRDALEEGKLKGGDWPILQSKPEAGRKLIVVTAHRRESFGDGFERICQGLKRLARRPDVQIVYPVHRNPNVLDPVHRWLSGEPNILLMEPLDYVPFVDLMRRAYLLVTDSGGIQEEGPSLGKPVLVMRERTERPEAVEAGTARLVGTDPERIYGEVCALIEQPQIYESMARTHNPYGDGRASLRIAQATADYFSATR